MSETPISDPRLSILIIDDTPANLMILGTVLSKEFKLQIATSGARGLILAASARPDLILLDVMMPEMDGYETCRRLKADAALADIPVIFVTALTDTTAETAGLALGAADFITKPINVEIARHRIRNLLERERLHKALAASNQAMARDIAARERAEETLRESEERYRQLIETASEGILVAQDGCLQFVNPMVQELTGYREDELVGQEFVKFIHPDDRPLMLANFVKRLQGENFGQRYPIRVLTKAGSDKWMEISGTKIDWNGHPATLNFVNDITERKKAEEELKRSNAELEHFSYAISHDMRQPLRMISSYLKLIETSLADRLDSEQREYFSFAIDGAKRLDQMMVGLLEYSRVGRKGEPPDWIESRTIIDEALLFLEPEIAEAGANICLEGDWPKVFVSRDEMSRLLQNLIGNAIKFRIAGQVPQIGVTSAVAGREWRVCISDNGVGIIPDQIDRLFQVFQRLQSRAAYPGNGVGLALCRRIIEHHGGRIWVESAGEHQGSRFYFTLPQRTPS